MGTHTTHPPLVASPPSSINADPTITVILDDLRRIVQTLRHSSRLAERTVGLSGAQLFVLKALATGGSLSLNEVARRTRTHQSTVSGVVKRLVAEGLVARAAAKDDGRRLELRLTRSGRALLAKAPGAAQEKLVAALEGLASRRLAVFAGTLRNLVDAMELFDEQPEMFFEEPAPRRAPGAARGARK